MSSETIIGKKATVACPFCSKLNRVDLSRATNRPTCGECGKPLLIDRPLKVTEQHFDRMIADSEVPVLVDFYADWCGPCKMMAPILDELAQKWMGKALILKLDTDRNPQVSARFQIRGIPTLILFENGREVQRQVGAAPKQILEKMLDSRA
jgi:thioredoxin 2